MNYKSITNSLQGVSIFIIVWSFMSCNKADVKILDKRIFVEGVEHHINGVCYNPIKKGESRMNEFDFSGIDEDIKLMKDANINTIRTYYPIKERAILDKFSSNGIMVIIGFPNVDDRDPEVRGADIQSGSYAKYIKSFKDHPAILMWEFGNEYNYHPEWFDNKMDNWYEVLEKTAKNSIRIDPNHPVSSAHGEVPDLQALKLAPSVQVWGINSYRWDDPGNVMAEWKAISDKPIYFSEAGTDSWDIDAGKEDREAQERAIRRILSVILENYPVCLGVTVFEFNDEWWKAGTPNGQNPRGEAPRSMGVPYDAHADEEYWGLVDIDRKLKPSFSALKVEYTKASEMAKQRNR